MKLSDFDYDLPKELIAQEGSAQRDQARLMVLRPGRAPEHRKVADLIGIFQAGDLLVLNDTQVLPAKLVGRKESGGKVDCLVLPVLGPGKTENGTREALIRGSNVRVGTRLIFSSPERKELQAQVLEKLEGAKYRVEFEDAAAIPLLGELPLPPYIKKTLERPERYQTVYARKQGSLAAPTAGLHFTPELLHALADKGVELAYVTLHIGIGTFAPIRTENLDEWNMHPEHYEVARESAERINRALQEKRRCFAVGTTSVRTLETAAREGQVAAGSGWTDIFIKPGYPFQFPYAGLLTNFHLPKSTLLLLVSALAGKERLFAAYQEALRERYRFYSLGDTMLIFP